MLHERRSNVVNGSASHAPVSSTPPETDAEVELALMAPLSARPPLPSSSTTQRHGVHISYRTLVPLTIMILVLIGLQIKALFGTVNDGNRTVSLMMNDGFGGSQTVHGMQMQDDATTECRWYLAESAIPNGGLGVFTAFGLHKDDMVGFPDICIFVGDAPKKWTSHLHSHTFGGGTFFGQYEGKNNRAACEGFTTIFNTAPPEMLNTDIISPVLQTNAKLHRATSPGAGAITHHYGISARAKDVIMPASELVVDYGDFDLGPGPYVRPKRTVPWLQTNGWCIDNIHIGLSPIPDAGRGAFARRPVRGGDTVGPAPLQLFRDRSVFENTNPEQLFVNYCLQPKDSTLLLFPYGPAINLINHAIQSDGYTPNVAWRWSTQTNSTRHDATLLNGDISTKAFWSTITPGMLILEIYALRDIAVGEELLLDYGSAWEAAWKEHVSSWKPLPNADTYVYPMDMDETGIIRTVREQDKEPYPKNIGFICATAHWDREKEGVTSRMEWKEPTEWTWWEAMTCCHVLDRKWDAKSDAYFYTVELIFDNKPEGFAYNPNIPANKRLVDTKVPRRAIRFIEVPYMDDEHMPGVFRHPIELPDGLVPENWRNSQ